MATKRFLKIAISLMSFPAVTMTRFVAYLNLFQLKSDLKYCLKVVDLSGACVPTVFIEALVLAEDHRNDIHSGIDPIGVLRAIAVRIRRGEIQGASTIEQQFVRTVTGRYERTMERKLREQALAILLSRQRAKKAISSAYLSIAFYGSGCIGLEGLRQQFGRELESVKFDKALNFIAQLKYPRPLEPTASWQSKISCRAGQLSRRARRTANITGGTSLRYATFMAVTVGYYKR